MFQFLVLIVGFVVSLSFLLLLPAYILYASKRNGYASFIVVLSVTFSTLGEKTTVMSPEVFVKAGVPCCR